MIDPLCPFCGKEKDPRWHDCEPWHLRDRITTLEAENQSLRDRVRELEQDALKALEGE